MISTLHFLMGIFSQVRQEEIVAEGSREQVREGGMGYIDSLTAAPAKHLLSANSSR